MLRGGYYNKVLITYTKSILAILPPALTWYQKYPTRINIAGELYLQSYASRSQAANKEAAILKFQKLIDTALIPPKKRHKTKRSKASIEARLAGKKLQGVKKQNRSNRLDM